MDSVSSSRKQSGTADRLRGKLRARPLRPVRLAGTKPKSNKGPSGKELVAGLRKIAGRKGVELKLLPRRASERLPVDFDDF